jgi:hypothetical protein
MNMTRKDYELIAATIRNARLQGSYHTDEAESMRELIAAHIAHELANDNPRFDRARFLKACGLDS